jgi:uncharacterized protein (DUF1330 family)
MEDAMNSIVPNLEQFQKFAAEPTPGPVVMLNLLKFRARAEGEPGSGADAYARYGEAVTKMLAARGARVLFTGRPTQVLVGTDADLWDAIALVEYPSRAAFIEMVSSAEYQQAHAHREAGLERTALIACAPMNQLPGRG